jgi:biotin carboxyl carrier protein
MTHLRWDGGAAEARVRRSGAGATVTIDGHEIELQVLSRDSGRIELQAGDRRAVYDYVRTPRYVLLTDGRGCWRFELGADQAEGGTGDASGRVVSHMPGKVLEVLVQASARVDVGDRLLVLEAMKMEHAVQTAVSGTVTQVTRQAGDRVMPGDLLVEIEPDA